MSSKRKIIPYNPDLKKLASQLRKNMTLSEVLLWNELKNGKMLGYDFDRQKPLDKFIVDFYCKDLNLAIEIDGDTHIFKYDYDEERQKELEKLGIRFLRFEDIEVKKKMWNVLRVIEDWIEKNKPTPRPSKEGSPGGSPFRKGSPGGSPFRKGSPGGSPFRKGSPGGSPFRKGSPGGGPFRKGSPGELIIGNLPLGFPNPVRIQSMTNTNTLDTKASVSQCIRIIEAGADLVRLTAQGAGEAENLANIKSELRRAGYVTPLVADIHFNPATAEIAARIVEKVRINPGNYADKRASFVKIELTDKEYGEELIRIHSRLIPLIRICRENNTVIRIGVNHGSLSDRIMTRYGNTPFGMAVSAMEFIRIFRGEDFTRLVISMKSSDTAIMVEATRMILNMMNAEGFSYPVHLGVTEAGEGEDGRIRSAAGIGALLAEGIGDTIRVSLSEDPENEIPVAKEIVSFLCGEAGRMIIPAPEMPFRNRDSLYKPEVLFNENGKFITESGGVFSGRILDVTAGSLPEIPETAAEKIIVNGVFNEDNAIKLAINCATILGRYFITRQADGICITNKGNIQGEKLRELSFSILQATDARITRNRYISCPTCGRTKFNLQEAVSEVKEVTGHLTGLKIAVMGCIVNGPGEMAGADYGYVGTAEGKVSIYRGMVPVIKNVPRQKAAGELLRLIEKDLD